MLVSILCIFTYFDVFLYIGEFSAARNPVRSLIVSIVLTVCLSSLMFSWFSDPAVLSTHSLDSALTVPQKFLPETTLKPSLVLGVPLLRGGA